MIDRRTMQRFEIELPAIITWSENNAKDNHFELTTSNICAGGAYFSTRRPLNVATQVTLEVQLPFDVDNQGRRKTVKINGAVIYNNKQGMGIAFDNGYQFWPEADKNTKDK